MLGSNLAETRSLREPRPGAEVHRARLRQHALGRRHRRGRHRWHRARLGLPRQRLRRVPARAQAVARVAGVLLAIASKNDPKPKSTRCSTIARRHGAHGRRHRRLAGQLAPKSQSMRDDRGGAQHRHRRLVFVDDSRLRARRGRSQRARRHLPAGSRGDGAAARPARRQRTCSATSGVRGGSRPHRDDPPGTRSAQRRADDDARGVPRVARPRRQLLRRCARRARRPGRAADQQDQPVQPHDDPAQSRPRSARCSPSRPTTLVRAIRVDRQVRRLRAGGCRDLSTPTATVGLDTLLMSCRVLGRGIETAFLASSAEAAEHPAPPRSSAGTCHAQERAGRRPLPAARFRRTTATDGSRPSCGTRCARRARPR